MCNNSINTEWIFIEFDTGEFKKLKSNHSNLTTTLHKDLCVIYRAAATISGKHKLS
jgi:hypothetical protein